MASFNLNDYETVASRIAKFLAKFEDGRIITSVSHHTDDFEVIGFKATLYKNLEEQEKGLPLSVGYAFETRGSSFINKTNHVENCETSAIGRALANCGLHGDKRASREEMLIAEERRKESEKQEKCDNFLKIIKAAETVDELESLWAEEIKGLEWSKSQYKQLIEEASAQKRLINQLQEAK